MIDGADAGSPSRHDNITELRLSAEAGARWSVAATAGRQILVIGSQIALARLLVPGEFGLAAMVVVITGFATVLVESGFGAALVQRRDIDQRHIGTVAVTAALIGAAVTLALVLSAPMIAAFYDEPRLTTLMRISAFSFAAAGIFVVPEALLTRELRFPALAAVELSALVAGCVVAIAAAAAGAGPFALAWQAVTVAVVEAVLGLALVRPSLKPFSWDALADLRRFGLSQLGSNSVNYWMRNADNVIVGHTFGSAALGAYARAYSILLLPVEQLSAAIGRVVFPSLSRMGDDRGRVRDAYLRVVALTVLVAAPIGAGMALTADPLVRTLLGENWLAAIPILRVLGGLAVIQALGLSVGWLYQSQGRTDLQLRWGICVAPFVVGSFVVGGLWGSPFRVAITYSIVSTVLLVPSVQIPGKLVALTIVDVLASARPALVGCMAMGVVVLPSLQLSDSFTPPVRLAICVSLGAATYVGALVVQRAEALADLNRLVRRSTSDR